MKDASIVEAIEQLRKRFGPQSLVVTDHWEADRCATGVTAPGAPDRLVYISTFAKPPGCFDVSFELPPAPGDDFPYTPAGDRADIGFEELPTTVGEFLGLTPLDRAG